MKRILVIDLMNLAFRAYHGIGRTNPLQKSDGHPTFVCFGIAMAFKKLIDQLSPDCIVIAQDSKGPGFRHAIYGDYKANRKASDSSFKIQIPDLFEMINLFGFQMIKQEGMEADDVIGSVVEKYSKEHEILIVSGDKDFMQLLGNDTHVKLVVPRGGNYVVGGSELSLAKFGVKPEKVIDCLALMGDKVDNVPGVRGIGEVGAKNLVNAYGDLENIYKNMHYLKKTFFDKLAKSRDDAFMSKQLVTIRRDLPVDVDLTKIIEPLGLFKKPELVEFFEKMEFNSLIAPPTHFVSEQAYFVESDEVPF